MSNQKKLTVYVMHLVDILSLIAAFLLSYAIKFNWIENRSVAINKNDYMLLILLVVVIYVIINILFLKNNDFIIRTKTQELVASFKMVLYVSVIVLGSLFFLKVGSEYSRTQMLVFIFLSFPIVLIVRILTKKFLRLKLKKGKYQEKILVISKKCEIDHIMLQLKSNANWDFNIVGIALVDADECGKVYNGIEVIAGKSNVLDVVKTIELDSVFIAISDISMSNAKKYVDELQNIGKNVHIRLSEYELCNGYKQLRKFGEFATVSYMSVANMELYQAVLRRVLEIVIGFMGGVFTIVTYPVMLIGMLIESPGKIIVSYVRIGKNGRRYYQYRYRVFRMDAAKRLENGKSPYMLIGKIAYMLHIDKLPGSFNVLCGDIGLIGVESPTLVEYMRYSASDRRKLCIKPGVIGEWSYRRQNIELAVSSEYDIEYEKTLLNDIKIFIMAMGRLMIYHPKRVLDDQKIRDQLYVIEELITYQKPYKYDHKLYQEKKTVRRCIYLTIKRLIDIILSLCGLIVLSPVFLILSILVIADDGGSPFYGHVRIGKYGKKIRVYKFRSMKNIKIDIEKLLTPEQLKQYRTEFKIDNDPRITKIGNFLRKSSLDELPQLINILKGDISIVGPRPIVEKEIKIYGKDEAKLLSVKPGLTGYWQAYARNNATYESGERQKMEMYYVDHSCAWLDVKIILKTIISVVKGNGAQ